MHFDINFNDIIRCASMVKDFINRLNRDVARCVILIMSDSLVHSKLRVLCVLNSKRIWFELKVVKSLTELFKISCRCDKIVN